MRDVDTNCGWRWRLNDEFAWAKKHTMVVRSTQNFNKNQSRLVSGVPANSETLLKILTTLQIWSELFKSVFEMVCKRLSKSDIVHYASTNMSCPQPLGCYCVSTNKRGVSILHLQCFHCCFTTTQKRTGLAFHSLNTMQSCTITWIELNLG